MQCETEVVQVRDCAYRDCRLKNACTRPPLQENQLLVDNALPLSSHPMPAGFMSAVEAEAPASPLSSSATLFLCDMRPAAAAVETLHTQFVRGDPVLAEWQGGWHPGYVLDAQGDTVTVYWREENNVTVYRDVNAQKCVKK